MKKVISLLLATVMSATFIIGSVENSDAAVKKTRSTISKSIGWKKEGKNRVYYNSGKKTIGWKKLNGRWYYFNKYGYMVTGTVSINGKKHAFAKNGVHQNVVATKKTNNTMNTMKSTTSSNMKNQINNVKQATSKKMEEVSTSTVKTSGSVFYDKKGNALGTGKKYISNASAYSGHTMTASGQRPRWGTIAVDPRVIPLGSRVYVPYFDKVFIANDTGGIIKGTKIDIFMNSSSEMYKFGRRNIEIVVLD